MVLNFRILRPYYTVTEFRWILEKVFEHNLALDCTEEAYSSSFQISYL